MSVGLGVGEGTGSKGPFKNLVGAMAKWLRRPPSKRETPGSIPGGAFCHMHLLLPLEYFVHVISSLQPIDASNGCLHRPRQQSVHVHTYLTFH